MKILLANKFYYHRGGDTTAVISTEQILRSKGHRTAVFSVKHPQNIPSPYEQYSPREVNFAAGGRGKISATVRLFRSPEVGRNFNRLLDDFRPDVVHLHNIHSHLSPLIAEIAHKRGIRTVWTLHDYKLICPAYACLRGGKSCELCFSNKWQVVKHACMKNSLPASILAWMEALCWNRRKLERITDTFISPSSFLKEKMTLAGYRPQQIEVLHNFMYRQMPPSAGKADYYCYVGRLSEEKGVAALLEAARLLPLPLKVIGDGPLRDLLRRQYPQAHIEFTGQLPFSQLLPIVQQARFLVMPSICYENNPFSVIEALCMGTPVLGAKIGGIPELITSGENGLLFAPVNVEALTAGIRKMMGSSFNYPEIANRAQKKFSAESFYQRLMDIYRRETFTSKTV
jgi:glycosyltransferase involved in cell wall biosynthesis